MDTLTFKTKYNQIEISINVVDLISGSEKQIEWANRIRYNIISEAVHTYGENADILPIIIKAGTINDSTYWINHRDDLVRLILKDIRDNQ